jgi:HNH endonuclease
MFVYVLDKNGQPLMPTQRFGKVRRLLRDKKAKVVRSCPFTIRLLYEPKTKIIQDVVLGVDTGSKHVGVACVGNDKVLYQSQVKLQDNIKKKMDRRRAFRRNRRNRKTRYRKARFLNRRNSIRKDKYCPTIVSKCYGHEREIEFCKKILPIKNTVFETAKFDTQLMEKPWLQEHKWAYQKGVNYGYENAREHALIRDKYTCQCCGKKNCRVEAHHIVFRSKNGSNDLNNYVTLCEDCHKAVHLGKIDLKLQGKRKSNLRHATQMSTIRCMLLRKYPNAIETFGFVTKANRENLDLQKDHYLDACVIASGGLEFEQSDIVFYKYIVSKGDYKLTRGARGEQKLPTGKVRGFRKFDKVRYLGKEYFINSRMSSGYAGLMNIFGDNVDFSFMPRGAKTPKLSNCERLSARVSCLCASLRI